MDLGDVRMSLTTWPTGATLRQVRSNLPGLVLVLGLGGWAVAALWANRGDRAAAGGAGMLLAVGIQGTWDWVLADPAVTLAAALLLGLATRRRRAAGASPDPGTPG
jgi:hypothetical protein